MECGSWDIGTALVTRILDMKTTLGQAKTQSLARELVTTKTKEGITSVWIAARRGDVQILRQIIEILRYQLNFSDFEIKQYISDSDVRSVTPLMLSVLSQDIDCIRVLLRNGADPDSPVPLSERQNLLTSPLVRACVTGNLISVKLLLHAGARRCGDKECLLIAAAMGHQHVFDYFEKTSGFCTRLHYAFEMPERVVLDLLRAGVDIHAEDELNFPGVSRNVSPVGAAAQVRSELEIQNESVPRQLMHVIRASEPWSPDNHRLFDKSARKIASVVFQLLSCKFVGNDDILVSFILPYLVCRLSPPLSRSQANSISLDWL
jgi:ankyrin repeat protein